MNGEVIGGRYRIEELIAEGGMAKVYRGTDERLGRSVAIKVLSADLASDSQFVTRFEAEAKAAASLDHSNVVRVFDTGSDRGRHYIVMQYVEGPTLAELLARRGRLAPDVATDIAARVCDALAAAHELGIVHRDIKPGNIMLEDGQTVKVMDFGIAKTAVEGLTQVGDVLGTAAYLSPEQARGDAVDFRSDLYSLGCVLYQMLTGRAPLPGDSLIEVAHRLANEEPAAPSELNPEVGAALDEIVLRALEKEPGRRFAGAEQMRDALRGERVDVGPPPAAVSEERTMVMRRSRLTRVGPRRGLRVLVLGVVGLSALVAGAAMVFAAFSPEPDLPANPPPPFVPAAETPSPSPSPSPSPESSPQPDPEPVVSPGSGLAEVDAAAGELRARLDAALGSGDVSEDAAEEILEEVDKARSEYEKQDFSGAVRRIGEAREELQKYVEREEVSEGAAASIGAHLDRLQRLVSL